MSMYEIEQMESDLTTLEQLKVATCAQMEDLRKRLSRLQARVAWIDACVATRDIDPRVVKVREVILANRDGLGYRKINTIKDVRYALNLGLADAKRLVEEVADLMYADGSLGKY